MFLSSGQWNEKKRATPFSPAVKPKKLHFYYARHRHVDNRRYSDLIALPGGGVWARPGFLTSHSEVSETYTSILLIFLEHMPESSTLKVYKENANGDYPWGCGLGVKGSRDLYFAHMSKTCTAFIKRLAKVIIIIRKFRMFWG